MIDAAEATGELEPGATCSSRPPATPGSRSRWSRKLKGYPLTCVMPENSTEERKRLLRLYGAEIVFSPGRGGLERRGPARARARRERPALVHAVPVREPGQPARPLRGHRRRDRRGARPRRRARRRPRHGRHADGHGRAPPRELPRRRGRRRRAAARRPRDGPALARRRLRPAHPGRRPSSTGRSSSRTRTPCYAVRGAARREGIFAGVSCGAAVHVARRIASELDEGVVVTMLADGGWKYLSAPTSGTPRTRRSSRRWSAPSGGDARAMCARRSSRTRNAEAPNEACGLVLLEGDMAVEYVPGRERAAVAVPLRARDRPGDVVPISSDDGVDSAVLPLARLLPTPPVAHRRRAHRPLAGAALPHLLGAHSTSWLPGGSRRAASRPCRSSASSSARTTLARGFSADNGRLPGCSRGSSSP